MKKSANLEYIEECIGDIDFNNLKSANNMKLISTIKRFLNREYGSISECKEIRIIDNVSGNLFGMTVAPTQDNINTIVSDVMSGIVPQKQKMRPMVAEYIIELDSKLADISLNLTNSEITAILIHELGHIVLNSKFVEDMNMIYIQEFSKKGIIPNNKSIVDLSAMLYVYNYITKHQLVNEIKNLSVERDADKFVIDSGYGKELSSALEKFAKYYTISAKMLNKSSESNKKNDMQDAAMYVEYAKSFETRQAFIKDIIGKEAKTTISVYWKNYLNKLIDVFVGAKSILLKNKFGKETISESLISRLLGITPNVTKKDIDEIYVEIEMAESYEDKMYLIRKIHSKIDDIDQVIEMSSKNVTDDNKRKIGILTGYKSQLQKLLNEIIKKKIKEKQYQVFVKAPKEYEG